MSADHLTDRWVLTCLDVHGSAEEARSGAQQYLGGTASIDPTWKKFAHLLNPVSDKRAPNHPPNDRAAGRLFGNDHSCLGDRRPDNCV